MILSPEEIYGKIDYRNPDYTAVYSRRIDILRKIKSDKGLLVAMKAHFRCNPWDFVALFGMTNDPRRADLGLPTLVPFLPWPRQVEYLHWLDSRWRARERGLVEKSRDAGATWLSVGWACNYWLFLDGFIASFGSRKEILVDTLGDDKSIFEKVRVFLQCVPDVFMPAGFSWKHHSNYMRIINPDSGAAIVGESGDEIGRGGRSSIAIVDEAAFHPSQARINAALSQNTNCQIDLSTFNGSGNEFYKNWAKFQGTPRHFFFDWRQDPRKNQAWYDKQKEERTEVEIAQEIDRNPNASIEGIFIPGKYVEAIINAHVTLGFLPSGMRVTAFDPADTGDDKATASRYGSVIKELGLKKQGDITQAIPWAIDIADEQRSDVFVYDADGMGAPTMKLSGAAQNIKRMTVVPYYGSGGVVDKDMLVSTKRSRHQKLAQGKSQLSSDQSSAKTNADTYENFRAQAWTWFYQRCQNTYQAIEARKQGIILPFEIDDLVSIDTSKIDPNTLIQVKAELSRPMRVFSPSSGKIMVESKAAMKKRGVQSPNGADAVVMAFAIDMVQVAAQQARAPLQYRPNADHMRIQ